MKNTQSIKQGLLLLGSFSIAYNISEFLHELGHAIAAWSTGGSVLGIVVHPFNWSYCYSFCQYPLFHTSAGVGISSVIAVLLFFALFRWAKIRLLPLLLIGPITLINNGDYLLVDTLVRSGGDACSLIDQGVHPAIIITTSIILLMSGFVLAILLIRKTGLLSTCFRNRLITLILGIIPYTFTALVWNYIFDRSAALEWLAYTVSAFFLTVLFAALPNRIWKTVISKPHMVTWKPIIVINCISIGLLVFLLVGPLSAGSERNLFNIDVEHFSERPESFPEVMTAPPYATDVSYSRSSNLEYPCQLLSYNFPESTPPGQIRRYITNIHQKHGYHHTDHPIEDPNDVLDDSWTEETEEIYGSPVTTKSYKQFWLKISSPPVRSFIAVTYMWKKGKFDDAWVIHTTYPCTDYEQLYHYATARPDAFDPNEIEQLKRLYEAGESQPESP